MKKAEQSALTRSALLKTARELFTEFGYARAATEEIVQRAGVTRGALYYHFRDKAGLFQAVLEEINVEIIQRVENAVQTSQGSPGDPWGQIVYVAAGAYLDACLDPAIRRIALIEAATVLGWEENRDFDEKYGLRIIRKFLLQLMGSGLIERQAVEPLACLILGAVNAAALYTARADDDVSTARKEIGASLERLLDGLRVKVEPSPVDNSVRHSAAIETYK